MTDWKFFVLGEGKRPLPNCAECANRPKEQHDPEYCGHLTCHGFYAATSDPGKLDLMATHYPGNPWAVRTGQASGIDVLDFEGPDSDPDGLSTLDRWEEWTGFTLPPTLVAGTPSGGRHLYYQHTLGVRSRNRVLPGLDVKADGGYVVAVHGEGVRQWLTQQLPALASPELATWLRGSRGARSPDGQGSGHALGYDYLAFFRDGAPGGLRDEFFNELMFRMRRRGTPLDDAYAICHEHWLRCEQPPSTKYYMPWEHVEGKLRHVYATVLPEEPLDPAHARWLQALEARSEPPPDIQQVGRVTIVRRPS